MHLESDLGKKEGRVERARAPESVGDTSLYQTDGASRKQPGAAMGPSTLEGPYWKPGRVGNRRAIATPPPDATIKIFIGDATNNIAEYSGLLEALRRAVRTDWGQEDNMRGGLLSGCAADGRDGRVCMQGRQLAQSAC